MKRSLSLVLVIVLFVIGLSSFTACGGKEVIYRDDKTVNVRVLKAGLGVEWVYTLQEKFEEAFAEEGYKLNVLTPSSDARSTTVIQEMAQGYDSTGIDLYITGNATPSQVMEGDYGELVEDITELVDNEYPIGYDGENESVKIKDKRDPEIEQFVTLNDKTYAFNWVQIAAGVVVNTRKLAEYGITELPRTTNELLAACEAIYYGANGKGNCSTEQTYPITYVLGQNGYASCAYSTFLAQYGLKEYKEFLKLQKLNDDGTYSDVEDPTQFYKNENLLDMIEIAYRFTDPNLAAPDSTTQVLDQAQAKIMKDKNGAVFMFNGQWFLNEVKFNYKSALGDIDFMNVPVNSNVGKKVFGEGTRLNLNDSDCDKLLSYIVSLVDENKEVSEIVSAVSTNKGITITEEEAQKIADARGIFYTRGTEHVAYIAKGSPKKDIAALVLRMMASDDFALDFVKSTNTPTPYGNNVSYTSEYKFVNSANKITSNRYASMITNVWGTAISSVRYDMGVTCEMPQDPYYCKTIADKNISIYDGNGGLLSGKSVQIYKDEALKYYNDVQTKIQDAWNNRKSK